MQKVAFVVISIVTLWSNLAWAQNRDPHGIQAAGEMLGRAGNLPDITEICATMAHSLREEENRRSEGWATFGNVAWDGVVATGQFLGETFVGIVDGIDYGGGWLFSENKEWEEVPGIIWRGGQTFVTESIPSFVGNTVHCAGFTLRVGANGTVLVWNEAVVPSVQALIE